MRPISEETRLLGGIGHCVVSSRDLGLCRPPLPIWECYQLARAPTVQPYSSKEVSAPSLALRIQVSSRRRAPAKPIAVSPSKPPMLPAIEKRLLASIQASGSDMAMATPLDRVSSLAECWESSAVLALIAC